MMRTRHLFSLTRSGLAVAITLLLPASIPALETGGLEGDFLSWGAGARALGMGNAFSAVADDATATYWNPAGLAGLERNEFSTLHAQLWEGVTYSFAAVALPTLVHGTFGFQAVMLAAGGAERRDAENTLLPGTFGELNLALGPSWSLPLNPWLSSGISVKYLGRWIDGIQSGFAAMDLGFLAALPHQLTVAATAKHVLSVRHGPTSDELPPEFRFGVAWRYSDAALVSLDLDHTGRLYIGAELRTFSPLFVRVGAKRYESLAGGGLRFDDVNLDYTAGLHQEFGLSHRISISLPFGESVPAARQRQAEAQFQKAYELYLKKGPDAGSGNGSPNSPETANDREECLRLLDEVLMLDPRNGAATYLKAKMKGEPLQQNWERPK